MVIAVDAMGGDSGPGEVVQGCVNAARIEPHIDIVLLGPKDLLSKELPRLDAPATIRIEDALDVISMDEEPAWAIRNKPASSIVIGNRLVKDGNAQAFVSAGSTGAVMAGALLIMGRIKGISRPAIMVKFPMRARDVYILDAGANADCRPENLLDFAIMANSYLKSVMKVVKPSVGLLSIGEERGKGNELVKEAYGLIDRADLDFYGNVEGRDIPLGTTDIVVCDGYTGNIVLKLSEGLVSQVLAEFKAIASSSLLAKLGGLVFKPGLMKMKERLDPDEYGGTLLLGVDGVCIICHGSSSAKAVGNAVLQAVNAVRGGVVGKIKEDLKGKPQLNV
ncbi:MAG: phosphate acyltransferase PlsX [Actinobacteria bacterium]|nr:phosphate acyltransferase PlsX [Actinomycetota bacterium]